jgi:mono/diheme cytochrome c family protein
MSVNTGIVAGPISYQLEGEQYLAVVAGARLQGNYYAPNYSRILAFKLGGTGQLPPAVAPPEQVLNTTAEFGTPVMLERGEEKYNRFCGTCHGTDGQSRGLFPDLRYSAAIGNQEVFSSIVLGGVLKENGMVSFRSALSPDDAEAVRAYMVSRAHYATLHGPGGFAALPGAARRPGREQARP